MKKTWYMWLASIGLTCSLFLSSCTGYNAVMRKHLENADNYNTYSAEIASVFYYDTKHDQRIDDYSNPDFYDHEVIFEVVFSDYEAVEAFLGGAPNPKIPLDEYRFSLTVPKENHQILFDRGFYDVVSVNTPIDLTASSYIYMDGNFFFIAAVTYNGIEYLDFEIGLSNITQMINQ